MKVSETDQQYPGLSVNGMCCQASMIVWGQATYLHTLTACQAGVQCCCRFELKCLWEVMPF